MYSSLSYHCWFDIILITTIFQLRNKAILSKMLSSEFAGLKTTKDDFVLARRNNNCIVFVASLLLFVNLFAMSRIVACASLHFITNSSISII